MLGPKLFSAKTHCSAGGLQLAGESNPALGWCMSHVPPSAFHPHLQRPLRLHCRGEYLAKSYEWFVWFLRNQLFSYLDTLSILRLFASGEAMLVFKQISAGRLVCHDNSANPQHDGLMGLIASCPSGANAPTTATHPRLLLTNNPTTDCHSRSETTQSHHQWWDCCGTT